MAKVRTAPAPMAGVQGGDRARGRAGRGWRTPLLAGCLLLASGVSQAWAAPTVTQMLTYRPRQEGINYTTPTAEAEAACTVELIKGTRKGSGWLLRDGQKNPLRCYFDTNGDNKIDVWSYFKDGVEVYREIDSTYAGKPDQYRWLNTGGSKWGIDENRDGKIEQWKAISPEEVSQEILAALITRDFGRVQALLITDSEIKTLEIPAEQAQRIREQLKTASAKFQDTLGKLTKLSAKATWLHLETPAPQCLPADQTGGRYDIVKYPRGTILYDVGGTNDWLQTGELIQVGLAWRITDAPTQGAVDENATNNDGSKSEPGYKIRSDNPRLLKLIEELGAMDKNEAPPMTNKPDDPSLARFHLRRADLVEKIIIEVDPKDRDPWIRQVADSLSTATQAGEPTAASRLTSLVKQLETKMTGTNLAAYVTYREMQADYAVKIAKGVDRSFDKIQQEWLERLGSFIQTYPKAEDTPDALLQAGMVSEFLNKDIEAKNWYGQLQKNYPDKIQGIKAGGAKNRLELEGKPLKLAAPLLTDGNIAFDVDEMHGKVAVVYYWASWNNQSAGDFAKLKGLMDSYGSKGLGVACVNLDNNAEEAREFLRKNPAPGSHLHRPGGLDSKLATDYGIMVLPQIFIIGKDGKVVSRNGQMGTLEDEIKKQLNLK